MVPILLSLFGTFAISIALTPLVRQLAHRLGCLARPSTDRWHRRPVALLGGFAMAASLAAGVAIWGDWRPMLPLLVGAALMFTLGALDDVLHFRPSTKLVVQTIVAGLVVYLSPAVAVTGRPVLDQLIALVWVVGITNAFNLLDNMDGLSAGIAALAGIFYLIVLGDVGTSPLATAIAAFVGATLGFLVFNFKPASIFMGDSGSLLIGSFLGGAALFVAPELQTRLGPVAAIPLFILLIPVFDTAFVTVTRRLAGRSPMVGGRDHLSHRLVALGIAERRAVVALYALATLGGLLAITLLHVDYGFATILAVSYFILLSAIGIVLGHVEAHAADAEGRRPPLVADVAYTYRVYEVMLDIALITLAYYAAFRLRFRSDPEFAHFLRYFAASFPIVLACQIGALAVTGKYRQLWRSFGSQELINLIKGIAAGVAASVLLMLYIYRFEGFSRIVFAIDAVLLVGLLVGSRLAITTIDDYLRRQRTRGGAPVLIYGAGRGGALVVRELLENRTLDLMPVGFLDDDPAKRRVKVEGLPVLGRLEDLRTILGSRAVSEVLVSIAHLDRNRLGRLASICREHNVKVRAMRLALEEIGPVPHVHHESHAS